MKTQLFRLLAVWPAAIWIFLFALVPLLMVLGVSFLARDESSFVAARLSLDGFHSVMTPEFLVVLRNSLLFSLLATLICLFVGYPFAYGLARCGRRRHLLLLLVIIPFWTNSLIRTYALTFLIKSKGVLSGGLLALGLISEPLSLLYTDSAVLMGMVYTLLPFMIMPIYAAVEKLDQRLVEAAHDLGAGPLKAFCSVTLPLTLPGIVAGCMMVFLPALGMFYIPDLLGGGRNPVIGNFIKNQFLSARDWPAGAAASMVLTLLMMCMLAYYALVSRRARVRFGGRAGGGAA